MLHLFGKSKQVADEMATTVAKAGMSKPTARPWCQRGVLPSRYYTRLSGTEPATGPRTADARTVSLPVPAVPVALFMVVSPFLSLISR